jgi:hypothetical protein
LTTRGTKILYQRPALLEVLTTMMMVDVKHCGAKGVDPAAELTATWPQAVQPDPEAVARTLSLLDSAGAISTFMKVKMRSRAGMTPRSRRRCCASARTQPSTVPAGDPFNTGIDPNVEDPEAAPAPESEVQAGADEGLDAQDEPGLQAA